MPLAELTYPVIDPIAFEIGDLKVRWYGISYMLSFLFAFFVLRMLAKRGRWPVAVERVADVLFWAIVGVVVGGRLGYVLFYMIPFGEFEWNRVYKIWEGGMSFHGGLIGVAVAFIIYSRKAKAPLGDLLDGMALCTTPGLFFVRIANFINAELVGTVTSKDFPLAMKFPAYEGKPHEWVQNGSKYLQDYRHPSQLYEAAGEGILLYLVLRYIMLRRKVGGGRIAGLFLIGYGLIRFLIEFVREPDPQTGRFFLGMFTRGQQLCMGMFVAGVAVLIACHLKKTRARGYDPETGKSVGFLDEASDKA